MVIGDVSRKWEDQRNSPFQGVAGKELDMTYLPLAGLRRSDIVCTDLVQCRYMRGDSDVKPPESLIKTCATNHIYEEISTVCPSTIILCGAAACDFFGISKLEFEHGYPRQHEIHEPIYWSGTLVPLYHPAAGLHESKFMIPQLEDWERLGEYLRGDWVPPIDLTKTEKPNYFLARTTNDVNKFFHKHRDDVQYVAIDSESDEGRDWSIQVSIVAGTGVMVLLSDVQAVVCLVEWVNMFIDCNWDLIFHQQDADIGLCENIGINTASYRDTMQELYIQGNLPQGLKAAVYRTLGKRMTSYTDTVLPWSKTKLDNWLASALDCVVTHLSTPIPHPVGPNCPTCNKTHRKDVSKTKPHPAEAIIRRVMKYTETNPDYDPWLKPKTATNGDESFRLLGQTWLSELEERVGRMPRASIVHVPVEIAKDYGCMDADMTGRLAVWLEKERERIVRKEWKVA